VALVVEHLVVIWPGVQKPLQALDQLQLQLVRRDPPWGVGVLDGITELDRVLDDPEGSDVLQGPAFGVSGLAGRRLLLLELAASLEEPGRVCESAVGGMAVAELAELAPPRARLKVVIAEVGLAEAALVGLAALEVAGQAAAAELAAAKAERQLVLHRRSCSFYMEARTRYHHIALSFFCCLFHSSLLSVFACFFFFFLRRTNVQPFSSFRILIVSWLSLFSSCNPSPPSGMGSR
jgi:hypothetical protein